MEHAVPLAQALCTNPLGDCSLGHSKFYMNRCKVSDMGGLLGRSGGLSK